ncbi:MAG: hypothetical protein PHR77_22530 [Kiritimatiellae bacterium]|jgi:hypothetical protein|nr:hypothetical protein [Kiritimatiellia bacterium]
MKAKKYLPRNDTQFVLWCDSFRRQFPVYASALGFSESDISAVTETCTNMSAAITDALSARRTYEEKTTVKNRKLAEGSILVREIARRAKVSPAYTEGIGKMLGIVGEGSSFDPNTAVPYITLVRSATGYDFKYSLMDYFWGVAVFRRNPGEEMFAQVGIDLKSPYSIDTPTVSGVEYRFQYVRGDELIGQMSDIIMVRL